MLITGAAQVIGILLANSLVLLRGVRGAKSELDTEN
jgi:hypothetical protein